MKTMSPAVSDQNSDGSARSIRSRRTSTPSQPGVFERLEADLPALILRIRRGCVGDGEPRDKRRLSAPDLDDPARLEMPDHRVERLGVAAPEPAVVVVEGPSAIAATFERKKLGAVRKLFQQRQLSLEIPVDARERPRLVRVAENIRGGVGRLVIVVRHDGDAGAVEQTADGVQIGPARSDEAQER